jgi:hypothetical protein
MSGSTRLPAPAYTDSRAAPLTLNPRRIHLCRVEAIPARLVVEGESLSKNPRA